MLSDQIWLGVVFVAHKFAYTAFAAVVQLTCIHLACNNSLSYLISGPSLILGSRVAEIEGILRP